ncbi:hypothetical protein FB45DRAFT_864378 [Roridomyces roridus]|uniref:Uncharacterized protein n=1 Tax=Roridomyces roridus TaxID=1738132 RepID=A0AAD7C2R7_9AGAR|nr:hypothetical protein FB45DRAFT_864378 [Roridomyces roridus]
MPGVWGESTEMDIKWYGDVQLLLCGVKQEARGRCQRLSKRIPWPVAVPLPPSVEIVKTGSKPGDIRQRMLNVGSQVVGTWIPGGLTTPVRVGMDRMKMCDEIRGGAIQRGVTSDWAGVQASGGARSSQELVGGCSVMVWVCERCGGRRVLQTGYERHTTGVGAIRPLVKAQGAGGTKVGVEVWRKRAVATGGAGRGSDERAASREDGGEND